LAGLKDAAVGAAGFFTLRGLPEAAALVALIAGVSEGSLLEGLGEPQKGSGQQAFPILSSMTAEQPAGSSAAAVWTLRVPKEAIEEGVAVAVKHGF
jgi:hypothetical protein